MTRGDATIDREKMMGLMLEACPSFRASWEEFRRDWEEEEEDPPLYLALADLARHLIGMLAENKTSSSTQIFEVVERWHVEGDDYVKEAATVGLLEDLQNANLHETTEPEDFRPFLFPESERWWDKLYGFWERGELLSDD